MKYLIDSGDTEQIARICDYYPIDGITTNPSIVAKAGKDLKTLITEIRAIIGHEKMLHVQALSETADDIMEEAKRICDFSGENTYIKIPVTVDGIKAIKNLHKKGYKLTGTAIFTPQQAMLAACAGADFVAPYINRLDNISTNGIEIAENIHKMLSDAGIDTEVLAASFSNVEQIHMTAMHGVTALTISPALFDKMLYHPLTINAVHEFIANGSKYYNI